MAIDTDNNQDSLVPFPEGQEEPQPRRRSDRTGKQAAKATRRPGRPPRSVAPLAAPELPPAPEKKPARRGRPPKNAQPAVVETQRRKPGRPPKARIAEVPPPPPLVPVPPPPAIFEQPEPAVLEAVEVAAPVPVALAPVPTTMVPSTPRRGPGRPRKVPTIDTPPPPVTVPAKPAMPTLVGMLAEPGNRIGEMGAHAVGFFRALFNLGATSEQAKAPEIEVLTTKDVARIVQAKESEVIQAITSGQLRATPIGKSWRTTPGNVKIWLEG